MSATEDSFYSLATADGLELDRELTVPWLSNLGHLNADLGDDSTANELRELHLQLRGNEELLASKRSGSSPRLDFVLHTHKLIIEVDQVQHFTGDRLTTLRAYSTGAGCAFDIEHYCSLVDHWRQRGDRYRAGKSTTDFPFVGGRRAQRAYFDACRDLIAPAHGFRVLRVPAPESNGPLAYLRFTHALEQLN